MWVFERLFESSSRTRLIPIDHGLSLPDGLEVQSCDLIGMEWPQALHLFGGGTPRRMPSQPERRRDRGEDPPGGCCPTATARSRQIRRCADDILGMSGPRQVLCLILRAPGIEGDVRHHALTPSELSSLSLASFLAGGLHLCADLVQPLHQCFDPLAQRSLEIAKILEAFIKCFPCFPRSSDTFCFERCRT